MNRIREAAQRFFGTSVEEANKELENFESLTGTPDLTTQERAMETPDQQIEVVESEPPVDQQAA